MQARLDAIDVRILLCLQQDGRISNQDLAEKVALSPSACLRRLRLLEDQGIILGYRPILDSEQLGIELEALVHVSMVRTRMAGMSALLSRLTAGLKWLRLGS